MILCRRPAKTTSVGGAFERLTADVEVALSMEPGSFQGCGLILGLQRPLILAVSLAHDVDSLVTAPNRILNNMELQPKVCDLSMALARMAGDVGLLEQMVVFFHEDAPLFVARLKTAVAGNDALGVQHAAHSLRGLLSTFTAEAAMNVALRLEQMGGAGDLACASAPMLELENEMSRMQLTLTAEMAKM